MSEKANPMKLAASAAIAAGSMLAGAEGANALPTQEQAPHVSYEAADDPTTPDAPVVVTTEQAPEGTGTTDTTQPETPSTTDTVPSNGQSEPDTKTPTPPSTEKPKLPREVGDSYGFDNEGNLTDHSTLTPVNQLDNNGTKSELPREVGDSYEFDEDGNLAGHSTLTPVNENELTAPVDIDAAKGVNTTNETEASDEEALPNTGSNSNTSTAIGLGVVAAGATAAGAAALAKRRQNNSK